MLIYTNMRNLYRSLLCIPLYAAFALAQEKPAADVLMLTDGEKLVGHFLSSHGGSLTFKSDALGEVKVDWSKVQELRSNSKFAVIENNVKLNRHSDLTTVPQGTIAATAQTITVDNAGATRQVAVANAAHVIDQPGFEKDVLHNPGFFEAWNGAITAGAAIVEATQKSRSFTGAVGLIRTTPTVGWLGPRDRTLADFSASSGTVTQPGSPAVKTSIYHGDFERDEYFSSKPVFGFGRVDFDHNFSQGLTLQTSVAGGLGYTVIKKPNTTLDFKVSFNYISQRFQTSKSNQNLVGTNFSEGYMRKTKNGILFLQGLSVTPAWNNTKAWTGAATGSMTVPVYKRFGFSAAIADNYLNDPPPGFKKNSFQLTMGLTYSLK